MVILTSSFAHNIGQFENNFSEESASRSLPNELLKPTLLVVGFFAPHDTVLGVMETSS